MVRLQTWRKQGRFEKSETGQFNGVCFGQRENAFL